MYANITDSRSDKLPFSIEVELKIKMCTSTGEIESEAFSSILYKEKHTKIDRSYCFFAGFTDDPTMLVADDYIVKMEKYNTAFILMGDFKFLTRFCIEMRGYGFGDYPHLRDQIKSDLKEATLKRDQLTALDDSDYGGQLPYVVQDIIKKYL